MLATDPRVERTALALGYASGAALTNRLKRYAGVTPTGLLSRGGTDYLLQVLRERCARCVSESRARE
jgi:AraC-like DNA-binding protein